MKIVFYRCFPPGVAVLFACLFAGLLTRPWVCALSVPVCWPLRKKKCQVISIRFAPDVGGTPSMPFVWRFDPEGHRVTNAMGGRSQKLSPNQECLGSIVSLSHFLSFFSFLSVPSPHLFIIYLLNYFFRHKKVFIYDSVGEFRISITINKY